MNSERNEDVILSSDSSLEFDSLEEDFRAANRSESTHEPAEQSAEPLSPSLSLPVLRLGVNEAIERLGFGPFQWMLLLLSGCIYVADSMEIMLLSFLSRTLACEWGLTDWEEASISTGVFVGMLLGTCLWGVVSDTLGRRVALIALVLLTAVLALLSAFSHNYVAILLLRSGVGFACSGTHVAWCVACTSCFSPPLICRTIFMEYVPNGSRNWALGLTSFFWSIGSCFEAFLAWLVLPTLGWKWLLILSALPFWISLVGLPFFPESTLYLRAKGQIDALKDTISRIARWNSKQEVVDAEAIDFTADAPIVQVESKGDFLDILRPQLRLSSLLLFAMWFAVSFSYYGMVLLVGKFSQARCYSNQTLANASHASLNTTNCQNLFSDDEYLDIFIVSLSEFPGILLTMILLEYAGRKYTLFVTISIAGVSASLLNICFSPIFDTILMISIRMCISGAFQAIYVYTPEVYPTHIRSTALGICGVFSRIGGMVTPFVAQTLGDNHMNITLSLYSGIMLLSAGASLLLPYETKGKNMGEAMLADKNTIHETSFTAKTATASDIALENEFPAAENEDSDDLELDMMDSPHSLRKRRTSDSIQAVPLTINI